MRRTHWQTIIQSLVIALSFGAGVARADGPLPYTEEWYLQRAGDPPGARQLAHHGKLWPPYPRPVGRKQTFSHAFHTAHYWPYPYNCQDRADVLALVNAQSAAGWNLATTLHDYHFDPETQQLTSAGQSQLAWILTSVPQQFRTVFVAQGATAEMGQMRAAAADKYLRDTGVADVPPVVTRVDNFPGRPGNEVDRLRMLELQSMPRPRLFLIGVAGRQGGGGMGAGGGGGMGMPGTGNPSGGGTGSTVTQPTNR
jgi:hypothetical protein